MTTPPPYLTQQPAKEAVMPRTHYRGEVWGRIPGWPAYEVSTFGQVRSYWVRVGTKGKRGTKMVIGSVPKMVKTTLGHYSNGRGARLHVTLGTGKSGGQTTFGVAYLVLLTFVGPPEEGQVARHLHDPDPYNCRLDNVGWGTSSENQGDTIRHDGKHFNSKLFPHEVREILQLIKDGVPQKDIAVQYKVCRATITFIKQRKSQKLVLC